MDTFSPAMDTPVLGSRTAFVCRNPQPPPANHESPCRTCNDQDRRAGEGGRPGDRGARRKLALRHGSLLVCLSGRGACATHSTNALGAAAARMGMARACNMHMAWQAQGRETHDLVSVGVAEVGLLGLRLNADRVGDVAQRVGDTLLRPAARSQGAAGDATQSARAGTRCFAFTGRCTRTYLAPGELVPPESPTNRHDGKQPAHNTPVRGGQPVPRAAAA